MNYGLTCEVVLKTTNVLCGVNLNTTIDTAYIANASCNTVLHNGKMRCLTWRQRHISDGQSVAVLFSCGKMTVTGNRTIHSAIKNCRKFCRLIQKFGFDVNIGQIKILAISVCAKFPNDIKPDIPWICANYGGQYEPELHNACKVKLNRINVQVFASGSLNITGLQNTSTSKETLKSFIYDIVIHGKQA